MDTNKAITVNPQQSGEIVADMTQAVVKWEDIKKQLGMAYEPIKAADLVGMRFIINRAKPFASSFKEQEEAYYCVVTIVPDGEKRSVVLGGGAVVETLRALAEIDFSQPIEFTLVWHEGGQFSGYYTLE